MSQPSSPDAFTILRQGGVTVIAPEPVLAQMEPALVDGATSLLREAIQATEPPLVVIDLARLDYFGSPFLLLLIRCWKFASLRGGMMALSGVSERARELLKLTSLDVVWPIYDDRREAIASLQAD